MNSTYVIKFQNCEFEINKKKYSKTIRQFQQILTLSPINNVTGYKYEINFEQLKMKNVVKLKKIEEIKFKYNKNIITLGTVLTFFNHCNSSNIHSVLIA